VSLPREVTDWRDRAEIDHVGPFVKAWAAFNAWYRYVSGTPTDREGIRHVCTHPNPVRSAILPFLDPQTNDTADAVDFKQDLARLHVALEAHRLETRHKGRLEHVSFRSVPIGEPKQLPQTLSYAGSTYRVCKIDKQVVSTINDKKNVEVLRVEQSDYDFAGLQGTPAYIALKPADSARLRALYADCDPRPMVDLLNGTEQPIRAGTITFRASHERMFAGTIQTIYRMRNMLLHGELAPDPQALAGFEHAFHLLRRMLRECR
jgi:hypothetical protein